MVTEGKAAPDFTLNDSDGADVSLSSFKGKNVVLYFYPKDDTPGCTIEANDFSAEKKAFEQKNAVILGISRDTVASHKKFCNKHSLEITLLSDTDSTVCNLFGVIKEKNMYGILKPGIERSTFLIGPDGTVKKIWRKVKANGHAAEVLEAI